MNVTHMNRISRLAVLEVLVEKSRSTVEALKLETERWSSAHGPVAPQVEHHFRREYERQDKRLKAMRVELEKLMERLPHGVYCEAHQLNDDGKVYCGKLVGHPDAHRFERSRRS